MKPLLRRNKPTSAKGGGLPKVAPPCLRSLLNPALPSPAGAGQGLSVWPTPTSITTHQPHHQVGEDSDPQRGRDEGNHEVLLPAGLAAVRDGDAQEEDEWPGKYPLGLVPSCLCSGRGWSPKGEERNTYRVTHLPIYLSPHFRSFFIH